MGGLAGVEGFGDTGDESFADPAEVICIYFDADAIEFAAVHDEVRGDAAEGLGEDGRGAAMQETVGLFCSLVNGHGCLEIVFADFGKEDAEVVAHGLVAQGLDVGGLDV